MRHKTEPRTWGSFLCYDWFKMKIAVITPTLAGRAEFLKEARIQVAKQTLKPDFHLIGTDFQGGHMSQIRNALVLGAQLLGCDWVLFYDDDDLLDSRHIEKLVARQKATGADAVYSWGQDPQGDRSDTFRDWDPDYLQKHNYISCSFLIFIPTFRRMGGFRAETPGEEWDFWKKLAAAKAEVACLPEVTWTYRPSARRI